MKGRKRKSPSKKEVKEYLVWLALILEVLDKLLSLLLKLLNIK